MDVTVWPTVTQMHNVCSVNASSGTSANAIRVTLEMATTATNLKKVWIDIFSRYLFSPPNVLNKRVVTYNVDKQKRRSRIAANWVTVISMQRVPLTRLAVVTYASVARVSAATASTANRASSDVTSSTTAIVTPSASTIQNLSVTDASAKR